MLILQQTFVISDEDDVHQGVIAEFEKTDIPQRIIDFQVMNGRFGRSWRSVEHISFSREGANELVIIESGGIVMKSRPHQMERGPI